MRRSLSIFIVALFFAAPLFALLPAAEDAQLPACCRRHGAHHCAMAADSSGQPVTGAHRFSAPSRCPLYQPGNLAPTPVFTLLHSPLGARSVAALIASARSTPATLQRPQIPSSRGPPHDC